MRDEDYAKLLDDTQHELLDGGGPAGVLGLTPLTLRLMASAVPSGLGRAIEAIYAPQTDGTCPALTVPVRPLQALSDARCGVLVVASDTDKEDLLCAALPFSVGAPKVVVAGCGHLGFRDRVTNAARLGLSGVVAEFGMFKGGTTMFLSRVIERLGANWPVIGFDATPSVGSRPAAPPLDMYDHPDCVFTDLAAVRRYLDGRDIEIIAGTSPAPAAAWKRKAWCSASSTPTTTRPPARPSKWRASARCPVVRSSLTTSPALTGSATHSASASPDASCSRILGTSACTEPASSTGSRHPKELAGEVPARAPAADLRPVLVLRLRRPADV
jgi:O-methyltransferase